MRASIFFRLAVVVAFSMISIVNPTVSIAQNSIFDTADPFGSRHLLRRMPTYVDARVLAASTNEDHTVPSGTKYVIFSSSADFYASRGGSAAVPSGDVTDGTGSELNPVGYDLEGVTTIGLISETAQTITMSFYN